MGARRHLILADITQSKLRGQALVKALGEMDKPGTTPYSELASGIKKTSKTKNDKRSKK